MSKDNMAFEYTPIWSRTGKHIHRVVYIEYHGRRPHSVITDHNGIQCNWDFDMDCKEIERFMYYNSGSGGKITDIEPPHWIRGYKHGSYWIHEDAAFNGKAKNGVKRLKPFKYKNDPNPFNHGRHICGTDYCAKCNKWYDEDACPEHHTVNDEGELVYYDGTKVNA